jgi:hypothetical protein
LVFKHGLFVAKNKGVTIADCVEGLAALDFTDQDLADAMAFKEFVGVVHVVEEIGESFRFVGVIDLKGDRLLASPVYSHVLGICFTIEEMNPRQGALGL